VEAGPALAPGELPPPPDDPPGPAARPHTDAVLARYRADMRRKRSVYYAVVAVVVAALGTWVGVAWSRGEISHASLHTFAAPLPSIGVRAPSQSQQRAWQSGDRIALGVPQWGGTVITYSQHTVGGRDARTGARTWAYTRTDRDVCTAAQLTGTTVAIYANKGNCDEVSAFDSDTGRRRWTRTLDMDGMPLNGHPSYQVTPYTMLIASHSVIYAIDPVTGYNRWTYYRYGCDIQHVVLGGAGALISQTCSNQVDCSDLKFCGRGPQLLLRNGSTAADTDKRNADQIIWNRLGDGDVPVSADDLLVSSVDPAGDRLQVLDQDNGNLTTSMTLTPATAALGPITAVATDTAEIVWLSGEVYALRSDATAPEWHTDSSAPPTVVSSTGEAVPRLATARIAVPTNSGIGLLDGNDGNLIQSFAVRTPPTGSVVYSLGTGFLVAGPSGIVAYR
jgi:hypothetical protein